MRISTVTVVRNGADTIANCLSSVERQSVTAEHIIVDGQSTDGTLDLLRKAQKRNPHLQLSSEADRGIYDAMSKGIRRATGEVIGCLNADDFYASSDVLEHVAAVFEDPTVDSCYGDLMYVRATGPANPTILDSPTDRLTDPPTHRPTAPSPPPALEFKLRDERIVRTWRAGTMSQHSFHWGWMPPHPTFFVRRSVYEKYGLFRLDLGTAADYELMLRFLVKHGITTRYVPKVLVKMLVGGVSNASVGNRWRANKNDRRAWAVNDLRPYPWTLFLKPMRKLGQWVLRGR